MFKQKNALISLAVVALLAACGGGGGDDAPVAPPPQNGGNNQPPPGNNPGTVDNTLMKGHLELVAEQVSLNDHLISISAFKAGGGYGFEKGAHAPIKSFGIRLGSVLEAGQTKDVRVAIDMQDTAAGTPNVIQLLIDKVTLSTNANGVLAVTVPATAKAYVYAKTAGGAANVTSNAALPADLVKLATADSADSLSHALTIDIDTAIARAKAGGTAPALFNSLPDLAGRYRLNATVSNVTIQTTAGVASPGASITVTGSAQPAVTGGGVQGFVCTNGDKSCEPTQ